VIFFAAAESWGRAVLGPVGFLVAIVIGAISFFSPCALPLLPGYLTFVSGLSGEDLQAGGARKRVVLGTSLFVAGFTTMFTLVGVAANAVYKVLPQQQIDHVTGAVLIAMGLAFAVPQLLPSLERERRPFLRRARPGLAGAFPLGVFFAAGWIPCVGPGLGAILALTRGGSTFHATVLLVSFSLGFGIWFVLAGLGLAKAFSASGWLKRHTRHLQIAGGVLMLAIGILLVTGAWYTVIGPLRDWVSRFSPPV
jgi:cytochrome c-type biogenesis protein